MLNQHKFFFLQIFTLITLWILHKKCNFRLNHKLHQSSQTELTMRCINRLCYSFLLFIYPIKCIKIQRYITTFSKYVHIDHVKTMVFLFFLFFFCYSFFFLLARFSFYLFICIRWTWQLRKCIMLYWFWSRF